MSFVIFQPDRAWLKKLIKEFGHYVTGRMLDVGAGDIDRYAKFFNYSERLTTDIQAGKNIDIVAAADNLPFADREFDSAVCTQVLEHVSNPQQVVKEINRVLKSRGYALVSVPLTAELHEQPHDYWRYTRYGIEQLFINNGFEVIENKQEGSYYSMIANVKIRHAINKYKLFERPFLGRIASKFFRVYGGMMMWRDQRSSHEADRRHTLGYVLVARKL